VIRTSLPVLELAKIAASGRLGPLGLILLLVLGVQLRWIRPFSNEWSAVVPPVLLIALHSVVVLARVYRCDLRETPPGHTFRLRLRKACRNARRSGGTASQCAIRSAGRGALGSRLVDRQHDDNGNPLQPARRISQFLVQSIAARDQKLLQAYVMVIAIWMLVMNGGAHLAMRLLDPRLD
jgi:hypothetical protein